MIKILELMNSLSKQAPILDRESDLERQLANLMKETLTEGKVRTQFSHRLQGEINIDIVYVQDDLRTAVELKYLTRSLNVGDIFLKEQGASDIFRYDVLKDLERLEQLVASREFVKGYLIVLTNEPGLWNQSTRENCYKEFEIYEGRTLVGESSWGSSAGPGTRKNRETSINLRETYLCSWHHYSNFENVRNGEFRYLVFEVS